MYTYNLCINSYLSNPPVSAEKTNLKHFSWDEQCPLNIWTFAREVHVEISIKHVKCIEFESGWASPHPTSQEYHLGQEHLMQKRIFLCPSNPEELKWQILIKKKKSDFKHTIWVKSTWCKKKLFYVRQILRNKKTKPDSEKATYEFRKGQILTKRKVKFSFWMWTKSKCVWFYEICMPCRARI